MGRKKTKIDASGDSTPLAGDNPFAALAGLRESLPEGEASQEPDPEAQKVSAYRVVLRRQRKGHGGKTVVRIEGLRGRDDWVPRIKGALGTGARWDGDDLIVQGDQTERLRALFEADGLQVIIGS
ncbi:MAG: translation initiation factor [Myxococcota bacterium]